MRILYLFVFVFGIRHYDLTAKESTQISSCCSTRIVLPQKEVQDLECTAAAATSGYPGNAPLQRSSSSTTHCRSSNRNGSEDFVAMQALLEGQQSDLRFLPQVWGPLEEGPRPGVCGPKVSTGKSTTQAVLQSMGGLGHLGRTMPGFQCPCADPEVPETEKPTRTAKRTSTKRQGQGQEQRQKGLGQRHDGDQGRQRREDSSALESTTRTGAQLECSPKKLTPAEQRLRQRKCTVDQGSGPFGRPGPENGTRVGARRAPRASGGGLQGVPGKEAVEYCTFGQTGFASNLDHP